MNARGRSPHLKVVETDAGSVTTWQILIVLYETSPVIWRRIQIPEAYSFWDFHVAIQDAMGWEDRHLHEFNVLSKDGQQVVRVGLPTDEGPDDDQPCLEGWKVPITRYLDSTGHPQRYLYDMGDYWQHALIFEGEFRADPEVKYPVCLGGARRCPPEDSGGTHGYERLLEALSNRDHPEHLDMLDWVGPGFDPDAFNPGAVRFDDPRKRWRMAFGRGSS